MTTMSLTDHVKTARAGAVDAVHDTADNTTVPMVPAPTNPADGVADDDLQRAYALAAQVADPEIPVLTVADLGVLRGVRRDEDGTLVVTITPTYSGCPAMDTIRDDILAALRDGGVPDARVELVLGPAWTTDWMSADGRRKLTEYGIAPPHRRTAGDPVPLTLKVACPQCGSLNTHEQSRFGSTACKALWRCADCQEPFDHFKTI